MGTEFFTEIKCTAFPLIRKHVKNPATCLSQISQQSNHPYDSN